MFRKCLDTFIKEFVISKLACKNSSKAKRNSCHSHNQTGREDKLSLKDNSRFGIIPPEIFYYRYKESGRADLSRREWREIPIDSCKYMIGPPINLTTGNLVQFFLAHDPKPFFTSSVSLIPKGTVP